MIKYLKGNGVDPYKTDGEGKTAMGIGMKALLNSQGIIKTLSTFL